MPSYYWYLTCNLTRETSVIQKIHENLKRRHSYLTGKTKKLVVSSCTGTQKKETLTNCVITPCMVMKTIGIPSCTGTPGQPQKVSLALIQIKVAIVINFTLHSRKSYETQVSSGLLLNSSWKLLGKRTINFEDDKFRTISFGDGDKESDYIERKQRLE